MLSPTHSDTMDTQRKQLQSVLLVQCFEDAITAQQCFKLLDFATIVESAANESELIDFTL